MADYQVAWNTTTKVATVQADGDGPPAGSIVIASGDFGHGNEGEAGDNIGNAMTHVLYHHVQDALYKIGHLDMQIVKINQDIEYVDLIDFTVVPATVDRTVGQTQQLTHVFNPTDASNKALSYVSSHPARATVSPTGLITAVGAGVATITVTSSDDNVVHTCVVTVT